ncbi:MAG: hypothetical protein ACTSRL_22870 [Candidatus Helarchaeota archaeon]
MKTEELVALKTKLRLLDQVLWNCLLILFFFQNLIHLHNTAYTRKSGQEAEAPI